MLLSNREVSVEHLGWEGSSCQYIPFYVVDDSGSEKVEQQV